MPRQFMIHEVKSIYRISEERVDGANFKLTATIDGQFAGKLEYTLFVFNAKTSLIADLEVLENFRRKGVATELLETAIEQIFKRPYMSHVMLQDGSKGKITGRMAAKLGFERLDERGLYWRLNKNVG